MKPTGRRDFLKGCVAGAAGIASGGVLAGRARAARKPNIIYILSDDLGYGDLGCYGQKRIKTPHIDRLSAEGMRFTDHYAGSTVCAPSRCVLMTGLHTGHCRIRGNSRLPIQPEDVTVAEILKGAGYATGLVGKWGLGEEGSVGIPTRQGFDYFYGYLNQRHAHNYYPEFLFRNTERVRLKNVVPRAGREGSGVASEKVEYSHDLIAAEALSFVERNKAKPFFLYLALTIPHANNEAGRKGMEVPSDEPYSGEAWPEPQKNHAAMITRMDRDIGRLIAKLKELGIDRDTVVTFTSDNGPHREGGGNPAFFGASGPLKGIKRDLYEGGIRVPMIARWPGKIAPGSVTDHMSAFWDFLPTACEVAGLRAPEGIDGISFLPTLLGEKQRKHDYLYWEFTERGGKQAVRMGRWKGIRQKVSGNPDAPIELYDLASDIGEKRNIASKHADIVAKIAATMKTARTKSDRFPLHRKGRGKGKKKR